MESATTSSPTLPAYLEARIRRPVPTTLNVVPHSTPVVAFGDFYRAEIATLGLNPSRREFLSVSGELLPVALKRFETTISLGVESLESAPPTSLLRIVDACRDYFDLGHNAYMAWFGQLNEILRHLDASYVDRSACHLDLVQWATDPTWASLPDAARRELLQQDAPFLREQLRNHCIKVVLLNGRRVITELVAATGCALRRIELLPWRGMGAEILVGALAGAKLMGWSVNLQSSFGVTTELRRAIGQSIGQLVKDG